MLEENLTIQRDDGPLPTYIARPDKSPAPGVVVIQEVFGADAVMRDVADGLAAQGFIAACPDLQWRIDGGLDLSGSSEADRKGAVEVFEAFDVDAAVADVEAAADRLRADPGCNGKVGVIGYGLGGLVAFLAATRSDMDAAVAYYAVGLEAHPAEPDGLVQPLMLHIAEADGFAPPALQAMILPVLKNHPRIEIHTYPERGHAFARRGDPNYNEPDARLADGRTLAFFAKHLG